VRERICSGLGFMGIEIDGRQNAANSGVISTNESKVTVRMIRTDEESMIAKTVFRIINTTGKEIK
jgi:acetate kinase